jgi:hypothetical protein
VTNINRKRNDELRCERVWGERKRIGKRDQKETSSTTGTYRTNRLASEDSVTSGNSSGLECSGGGKESIGFKAQT